MVEQSSVATVRKAFANACFQSYWMHELTRLIGRKMDLRSGFATSGKQLSQMIISLSLSKLIV